MRDRSKGIAGLLEDWLETHGYDGLENGWLECECGIDDLIPCGKAPPECEPVNEWEREVDA